MSKTSRHSPFIAITGIFLILALISTKTPVPVANAGSWWSFQSIDTMKFSRDPAREKLTDSSFSQVVDTHVKRIADTGVTHVAIATPYDDEFIPILRLWVTTARKYHLNIWFRGNWSGWEGWFSYPRINRQEHLEKTCSFIQKHPDLFLDGDVFSACPECENGGPGDPRNTGDTAGHRRFLIDEHEMAATAFKKINKAVNTKLNSMNGDVARLIMNRETTAALGGIVVIDHYVATPEKLASDIQEIARQSGGQVVLGEFGAPIPDIHGNMTPEAQSKWIANALEKLTPLPELVGLSYWTNVGGSTALWNPDGSARPAVNALTTYFKPAFLNLHITNVFQDPIKNATLRTNHRQVMTDDHGDLSIPYIPVDISVDITAPGYVSQTLPITTVKTSPTVTLIPTNQDFFYRLRLLLHKLFNPR